MELIDSHAHIDAEQFVEDRDAMLERARRAGVTTLVAIGTGRDRRNWMRRYRLPTSTTGFTRRLGFTRTSEGSDASAPR